MKNHLPTTLFAAALILSCASPARASSEQAARAIANELGLNSPLFTYSDTGFGPDATGANNGAFDWNDADGDGLLGLTELSEAISFIVTCTPSPLGKGWSKDYKASPTSDTDLVDAVRAAAAKYPHLALGMGEVLVASANEGVDPECLVDLITAISEGAGLGPDANLVLLQMFVQGFPNLAVEIYDRAGDRIFFVDRPQPPFPDLPLVGSPDDLPLPPISIPVPTPTPTPARPRPTPIQPSPTPVTPFQNT